MFLNGEGIEIFHQPAAHTDGDAIVFFRRSDVSSPATSSTPRASPSSISRRAAAFMARLPACRSWSIPPFPPYPSCRARTARCIIPGHGRVCDQLDVVEYRDMVTIIRDRIRDLMKQGLTLEQVKAASPARGYLRRYGSETGGNDFVEAVYRSMGEGK